MLNFFRRSSSQLLLALVFFSPVLSFSQQATRPFDLGLLKLGTTQWQGVYFSDVQAGIGSKRFEKRLDGNRETIQYTDDTVMQLTSFGLRSKMKFHRVIVFDAQSPYRMLRGTDVSSDNDNETRIEAEVTDGNLVATIQSAGRTREMTLTGFSFSLPELLESESWISAAGPKIGDSITSRDLSLADLKFRKTKHAIKRVDTQTESGETFRKYLVASTSEETGRIDERQISEHGEVLSTKVKGLFELRRISADAARSFTFSDSALLSGIVKIDKKIGNPFKIKSMEIKTTPEFIEAIEVGLFQNVETRGEERIIKLGRENGVLVAASKSEIQENLTVTPLLPSNDLDIQTLTRKAIGSAQTSAEKIERLVPFVHQFLKYELQSDQIDVLELLKRRAGKCSDYSRLLATMARAAGIPCRETTGLIYMGDQYQAFAPHAWNEVAIDGYWIPVDATVNEVNINMTHIQIRKSHPAAFLSIDEPFVLLKIIRQ